MHVTIYSKDNCPYCEKVKRLFELINLNFVEYKLNENFTRQNFIDKFGEDSGFPQVLFGDKLVGGCVETISYLKENNLL